ncbi:MAG: TlpA family protein disulfide reductase [Sphingobacteriales bacterium]|nr:MAG: TlpA family protein disulfide reductase [Sphingobacteriales bacterium]
MNAKILNFMHLLESNPITQLKTFCLAFLGFVSTPCIAQNEVKQELAKSHPMAGSRLNAPLPLFESRSTSGKLWTNQKLEGKVTLVNFWFVGCAPCMAEFRYLDLFLDSINHEDFQVLTFARNTSNQIDEFLNGNREDYNFIKKFNYISAPKFDIIPSCKEWTDEEDANACPYLSDSLGVTAFPTTILVDRNGLVRFSTKGFPVPETSASKHQPLIEEKVHAYFDKVRTEIKKLLEEQP